MSKRKTVEAKRARDSETEVVRYSLSELRDLVDREARAKLGISGEEFVKRLESGQISPESPMERSVAFLAKILKESKTG